MTKNSLRCFSEKIKSQSALIRVFDVKKKIFGKKSRCAQQKTFLVKKRISDLVARIGQKPNPRFSVFFQKYICKVMSPRFLSVRVKFYRGIFFHWSRFFTRFFTKVIKNKRILQNSTEEMRQSKIL